MTYTEAMDAYLVRAIIFGTDQHDAHVYAYLVNQAAGLKVIPKTANNPRKP